jgi:hypothetical protein
VIAQHYTDKGYDVSTAEEEADMLGFRRERQHYVQGQKVESNMYTHIQIHQCNGLHHHLPDIRVINYRAADLIISK